jgi:hypothetical protein
VNSVFDTLPRSWLRSRLRPALRRASWALLLVTGAASGVETDNAPAGLCVATDGAVINQLPGGEIENPGTSTVTVVCPANRRVVAGVYTTKFSGVAFGRDNNSSTNLCCKAVSASPSTSINGTEVCTSGVTPPANFAQLSLPELTDTGTNSHFFIQCKLPGRNPSDSKRSQLYSFRSVQR